MMNKKLVAPLAAFVILGGTLFAVPQAHAQETTPAVHQGGFFQGLIQFLEQKFGLDKSQVQSAIGEYQQQHKNAMKPRPTMNPQDMQAREQKRLDALVKAGKITSDQENAILSELQSLRSKYNPDSMKDLTPDQRKTQMEAMENELKAWAQSQSIDPSYVMPGFGMRGFGGKGMGRPWGHGKFGGAKPSGAPTSTQ